MTPRVRLACVEDIPAIVTLAGTIWRAHYPEILSRDQIDYMLGRMYAAEVLRSEMVAAGIEYLLAETDRGLSGFAAWSATERTAEFKLHKLYVEASSQRKGIGAGLLNAVMAGTRGRGGRSLILCVNKKNTQALSAYARFGFHHKESVVVEIGSGFVMDDYVLEIAL